MLLCFTPSIFSNVFYPHIVTILTQCKQTYKQSWQFKLIFSQQNIVSCASCVFPLQNKRPFSAFLYSIWNIEIIASSSFQISLIPLFWNIAIIAIIPCCFNCTFCNKNTEWQRQNELNTHISKLIYFQSNFTHWCVIWQNVFGPKNSEWHFLVQNTLENGSKTRNKFKI